MMATIRIFIFSQNAEGQRLRGTMSYVARLLSAAVKRDCKAYFSSFVEFDSYFSTEIIALL